MSIIYSLFAAALDIFGLLLNLYIWVLVIGAVLSWLVAFDVINTRNRFVQSVGEFIFKITDPALRPIRRFIPPMGGIDVSPVVLIFILMFVQSFIHHLLVR